ncbi:AAA family ATPase [Staphylococcus haemolyticus]|uniref:AAA family ATPase n=1 Tax=Staphylococcus haemolyticus TaxID=1283 RepID=UPI000A903495|nr:AAA family ATPase [Staphylococcus haemolyticus]MDT4299942.1 AAA family ATPase [Staphylococcus haemolyticus]
MKISNVVIKNYRNIKDINISLNDNVVLIGDNNSGKSNFLKALTLPLINHETGYVNKLLNWQDINKEAKEDYFNFLKKIKVR